ncbi:MAG TPA: hypothetical protein PKE05_09455 [Microthrixaceae bacterium]|nr:hypothetical protein [Microthrixaceae bacterium]
MTDLKFRTLPLPQLITGTSGLWRGVTLPVLGNWMPTLTDRLLDLSRLPVGWDGDRGLPVDAGVVRMSHGLLQFLCDAGMPEPVVVPTPSGGLQIEWHDATTEIDLELSAHEPATVFVWMQDESGDESEYEGDLKVGADLLGRALNRIDAATSPSDR